MRNSRMSLLGACVFVFGSVLIAAEFQESAEKDMQFFEGSFTMVSSEKKGEKATENIVKSATITNKNGVHSVKVGEDSFGGTHKIDPTKKPKEIDCRFLKLWRYYRRFLCAGCRYLFNCSRLQL